MRAALVLWTLCLSFAVFARQGVEQADDLFSNHRPDLFQVRVIELASGNKSAIGSGFRVGQGVVATNFHVISQFLHFPDRYRIELADHTESLQPARLLKFDIVNDLALLSIASDPRQGLALAPHLPQQGEAIFSLGNPHDLGMIVVPGTFNGIKASSFYQRIHFTGAVNPGMSGGPVINRAGQIVGVNVATAGNQIGFLVPLPKLKSLVLREVTAAEQNSEYQLHMQQQLSDNQTQLMAKLLDTSWPQVPLGEALIPGKVAEFITCWGDSNAKDKEAKFLSAQSRCRLGEDVFVENGFRTGTVELEFEWLDAKELSSLQFFNLYQQGINNARAGNQAGKTHVTRYVCDDNLVAGQDEVPHKTAFCARAYSYLPDLYDVLFISAAVKSPQHGLVSHFTLSGVTMESAQAFTSRFLESIAWQ